MLLSTRIVLVACLALLGVSGLLVGAGYIAEQEAQTRYNQSVLSGNDVLFRKIINGQQVSMRSVIRGLTRNREALKALSAGDRKALEEATLGLVNRLTAGGTIDRLSISDKSGRLVMASEEKNVGSSAGAVAKESLATRKILYGITRDPDGKVVLNVATPVLSRGKVVGVGIFGRSIDVLIREFAKADASVGYLLDPKGSIIYAPAPKVSETLQKGFTELGSDTYSVIELEKTYSAIRVNKLPGLSDKLAPRLVSVKDVTTSVTKQKNLQQSSLGILAGLIMVACGLLYWYLRRCFSPLSASIGSLKKLADGDMSVEVEVRSNDEIGSLGNAINQFKEKMQDAERLRQKQAEADEQALKLEKQREDEKRQAEQEAISQREREAAERQQRTELIEALIAAFDEKVTTVLDTVGSAANKMQSSAESMSNTADHTSQRATAVAGASDEATGNVQVVAAMADFCSASLCP